MGQPPEVPGYRLGEPLGQGSSGTVWAAVRERDGVDVAVKVVRVVEDSASQAVRELTVLGRVEVEGLVGFHEAVGLPGEPPTVALVLDRVRGGSLAAAVAARGHLSVGESVTVLAPVARALGALHATGVVHGDVQPANVLLERTGRPLLSDLGVARLAGEAPGDLYGTVGFVAPEVAAGGPPTPASDVYAVGAVAWWCVTGVVPAPPALRPPLEELVPGLPEAWREVTARALAGDPALRPEAPELALAYFDAAPCEPLQLVVGSDETSLLTQRLRSSAAAAPAPEPRSRGRRPVPRLRELRPLRPPGRRVRTAAAAGLAVTAGAAVVVAVAGVALRHHPEEPDVARVTSVAEETSASSPRAADPTGATPSALTDRTAPQRDPRRLMQALSDRRAAVMNSGDRSGLELLDAPSSPALASDRALLAGLEAAGQSYDDVVLRVRSARAVRAGQGDAARTTQATVEAVVDTTAYTLVVKGGTREAKPPVRGEPMRFDLRWLDEGWRIERVSAVTAG